MTLRLVVADDDADDRMLISEALEESKLRNPVDFCEDGVDLLEYLRREGRWEHLKHEQLPGLILLDLNMPRMDGRTALEKIRADEALKRIPIVILTTSKSEEDIIRTYNTGVNSFITKPVTFDGLMNVVSAVKQYWFEIVALPPSDE
ncbi:MAG: response regulator [Pseudomonadota bacterium]